MNRPITKSSKEFIEIIDQIRFLPFPNEDMREITEEPNETPESTTALLNAVADSDGSLSSGIYWKIAIIEKVERIRKRAGTIRLFNTLLI